MHAPGNVGKEVRIIAQSQFDVNQENIEDAATCGSNRGAKMIFSSQTSSISCKKLGQYLAQDIALLGWFAFRESRTTKITTDSNLLAGLFWFLKQRP
jgi:hypothetical protein